MKEIKYICDIHGGKFEKPEQVRNEINLTDKYGAYTILKEVCDGCFGKVMELIKSLEK